MHLNSADSTKRNDPERDGLPRSAELVSPEDGINRQIIRILEEDGRTPFSEIASALGISEGTARNRVNWMKRSGMLRILAIADPMAFSYAADAILGLKVARGIAPRQVAERLAGHPEVVYILWVAGRYDLIVEIVCESHDDFLRFLAEQCYSHNDIASIETMTGLAMFKNQFLLKRRMPPPSSNS